MVQLVILNPLECKGNYSATSNNMKSVQWPLMGGCYNSYSEQGTGQGSSLLAVPIAHPSFASVPITVLLYTVSRKRRSNFDKL